MFGLAKRRTTQSSMEHKESGRGLLSERHLGREGWNPGETKNFGKKGDDRKKLTAESLVTGDYGEVKRKSPERNSKVSRTMSSRDHKIMEWTSAGRKGMPNYRAL